MALVVVLVVVLSVVGKGKRKYSKLGRRKGWDRCRGRVRMSQEEVSGRVLTRKTTSFPAARDEEIYGVSLALAAVVYVGLDICLCEVCEELGLAAEG